MTATERKPLSATDRRLVEASAKLRALADVLAEELPPQPTDDLRHLLVTELRSISTDLWELVE